MSARHERIPPPGDDCDGNGDCDDGDNCDFDAAAVTYREPPSRGPFLNEPTTILNETLEIGRSVLGFLLPVVTAAMDAPTKESR